jgi:hypothetical protein
MQVSSLAFQNQSSQFFHHFLRRRITITYYQTFLQVILLDFGPFLFRHTGGEVENMAFVVMTNEEPIDII